MNLLYMTSETLHTKYGQDHDLSDHLMVCISRDIGKTDKKVNNSISMTDFAPSSIVLEALDKKKDPKKKFKKKYKEQLHDPVLKFQLYSLLSMAIKDDSKVIFVTSPREKELGYHKVFIEYIDKIFGLKVKTYKEFKENSDDIGKKKIKGAMKVLTKELKELKSSGIAQQSSFTKDMMIIDMKNRLNEMDVEELAELAVSAGYGKKSKELSKKELIQLLLNDNKSDKKKKKDKKKK